jgi:hypothetical protein
MPRLWVERSFPDRRRMIRTFPALLFAALAAGGLAAAKPPAVADIDPGREVFRGQTISVCVADLRAVPDLGDDDLEGLCGCTIERFMAARPTGILPFVPSGHFHGVMENELLACAGELRPDRAGAIAGRAVETPVGPYAQPFAAKPPADEVTAAPDTPRRARFDLGAWLRGLDIPAMLRALPAWAWVAIVFLVLGLLIALFRRRDGRGDLLGPPRSMRPGGGIIAPAPRRPDLPRPFRLDL